MTFFRKCRQYQIHHAHHGSAQIVALIDDYCLPRTPAEYFYFAEKIAYAEDVNDISGIKITGETINEQKLNAACLIIEFCEFAIKKGVEVATILKQKYEVKLERFYEKVIGENSDRIKHESGEKYQHKIDESLENIKRFETMQSHYRARPRSLLKLWVEEGVRLDRVLHDPTVKSRR